MVVTACSSSAKSSKTAANTSGGGGTNTSTAGTQGTTDEVTIASVGNYSGVSGAIQKPGVDGLDAFVKALNARGGVNGHKINLIVEDDRGDATRARSVIQDLVENKGAVAFAGDFASLTQSAAGDYLLQKRIPVMGGEHGPLIWWQNPMWFPFGADTNFQAYGYVAAAKQFANSHNLGIMVCTESPACGVLAGQMKDWATRAAASVAAPDYTAQCLAAKSAGVDALFIAFSTTSYQNIARDCSRQGYHPKYIIATGDATEEGNPEFEGAVTATPAFPPQFQGPATQDYHAAMKKYDPQSEFIPFAAQGWVIGLGLEKVLKAITGPVTSAKMLDQLWTFKDETLGGLSAPLTFIKDQPAPRAKCTWPVEYKNQKMSAPAGLTSVCAP
jgi:branched-chain amino acid transport system substrate-binding protein